MSTQTIETLEAIQRGVMTRPVVSVGPDGFPLFEGSAWAEAHGALDGVLRWEAEALEVIAGLAADEVLGAIVQRLEWVASCTVCVQGPRVAALMAALDAWGERGEIDGALEEGVVVGLLDAMLAVRQWAPECWPSAVVVALLEAHAQRFEVSARLGELVRVWLHSEWFDVWSFSEHGEFRDEVVDLLERPRCRFAQPGHPFADAVVEAMHRLDAEARERWNALLEIASRPPATRASKRWLRQAERAVEAIGQPEVRAALMQWFELAHRRQQHETPGDEHASWLLDARHEELLRGLVWACVPVMDGPLAAALAELALTSYKKIPNVGPRAPRLGNACIQSLGASASLEAAGQLVALGVRLRYASAEQLVEREIDGLCDTLSLGRQQLEDRCAPTFGMSAQGVRVARLGEWRVEHRLLDGGQVETAWINEAPTAQGDLLFLFSAPRPQSEQKSPPRALKDAYPEQVKAELITAREIERAVAAQRERLERSWLLDQRWTLGAWRAHLLGHPILGALARRLIWQLHTPEGVRAFMPDQAGALRDAHGADLDASDDDAQLVTLWHPLDADAPALKAWRRRIVHTRTVQPFKQAYRETYTLDALPAPQPRKHHIPLSPRQLRQHQLAALCKSRGWRHTLWGRWEATQSPSLELPTFGLRAQLDISVPVRDRQTTDAGVYTHVTARAVRLLDAEDQPVSPEALPARALSEVIRDVDLFLNVCAEEADRRLTSPWNATLRLRREVIADLLPLLHLTARCEITDHTVEIFADPSHLTLDLNTGGIFEGPDQIPHAVFEEHLAAPHPLPFEGDHTLRHLLDVLHALGASPAPSGLRARHTS